LNILLAFRSEVVEIVSGVERNAMQKNRRGLVLLEYGAANAE
jgi:hypothetical protein